MLTERGFKPMADRYWFDFGSCTYKKGWAQIDTSQDASYFGTWTNPDSLELVTYCEGDVTRKTAESDAEYVEMIREHQRWNGEHGHTWGIDPGFKPAMRERFEALGLGNCLH